MKFTKEWLEKYEAKQAAHQARADRPPSAKPKQVARHEPLVKEATERPDTRRRVTVSSYRVRLLDQDNVCVKYHVDGLRYAGVIRDDTTNDIELFVRQYKVKTRQEERTEIEVI